MDEKTLPVKRRKKSHPPGEAAACTVAALADDDDDFVLAQPRAPGKGRSVARPELH